MPRLLDRIEGRTGTGSIQPAKMWALNTAVPAIYVHGEPVPRLSFLLRLVAIGVAVGCLTVLVIAGLLSPSPAGVGTHTAMNYPACDFLRRTGLPCPSCGMTTSFAWFARGNLLASLYVQPMGMVLAMLTAVAFWVSLYMGLTGKPALRLLRFVPGRYYLFPLFGLAIAAWGWKMFIILRGIDGWG
jgi:hypothetical protein